MDGKLRDEEIKICFFCEKCGKNEIKWVNEVDGMIQWVITGNLCFMNLLTKIWSESTPAKGMYGLV
jgi:hypothetical protein